MKKEDIKKVISKLPDTPGVYRFLRKNKILYIGKATSLRDRVRSYFNAGIVTVRSPLISKMLSKFDDISFQKTDSVLEALVLEANLIKKYQPTANIKEKDNRSFNYIVITKEDFPRVLVMRERELEKLFELSSLENPRKERRRRTEKIFSKKFLWFTRDAVKNNFAQDASKNFSIAQTFGPFPNGSQLKEAVKIVRKMFPFRDKCLPLQGRPCFNRQIGLCPGVCTGEIDKEDYAKIIKNIVLFFEGNKKKLIKNLEKQMKDFAKTREFEKAQKIKKTIFTLNHIQDISLLKIDPVVDFGIALRAGAKPNAKIHYRIESYDIAHFSGTNVAGVMIVIENGEVKKSDYRKFKIKNHGINDTKALSEILSRRLAHLEWPKPDLIVVDGGAAQRRVMEKVLKENGIDIPTVSVVKDVRHRPKEILGTASLKLRGTSMNYSELESLILLANAEAHRFAIGFHKQLRRKLP